MRAMKRSAYEILREIAALPTEARLTVHKLLRIYEEYTAADPEPERCVCIAKPCVCLPKPSQPSPFCKRCVNICRMCPPICKCSCHGTSQGNAGGWLGRKPQFLKLGSESIRRRLEHGMHETYYCSVEVDAFFKAQSQPEETKCTCGHRPTQHSALGGCGATLDCNCRATWMIATKHYVYADFDLDTSG